MEKQKPFQILVPDWLRREDPVRATFCDFINADLAGCPQRTLEDLARLLDLNNKKASYIRLRETVRKQFGGEA